MKILQTTDDRCQVRAIVGPGELKRVHSTCSRKVDTFTSVSLTVKRTVVGLLACSVKLSGSKPKLKVRTLDGMFKKISSTH